jgi:hypothetical protein
MAASATEDQDVSPPSSKGTEVATALHLWPEEFREGWDRPASRLFLPALAAAALGTVATVRITIRGTGIAATVTGPVVAARRIGSSALVPGVFLSLEGRGFSAADYLERVSRGQPVDFNERDPRYAVSWRVALSDDRGRFWATTVNVSQEGCLVTWPGPVLSVGSALRLKTRSLFGPTLTASVCWAGGPGAHRNSAGLRLRIDGRAGRRWRSAVERAAQSGAPLV